MIHGVIGKQIALALSKRPGDCGCRDLNRQGVKEVVQQIRKSGGATVCMAMDVTNEYVVNKGIERMVPQFGALDVLVANAGVQILNPPESGSLSDWRKMQAVRCGGAILINRPKCTWRAGRWPAAARSSFDRAA